MTVFDDRQKGFENKFKLDEERLFKLNARAVSLFGAWAAQQLGLEGADAEAYAQQVVDADFEMPGTEDFLKKVEADFSGKGIEMSFHQLENHFNALRDKVAAEMFPVA